MPTEGGRSAVRRAFSSPDWVAAPPTVVAGVVLALAALSWPLRYVTTRSGDRLPMGGDSARGSPAMASGHPPIPAILRVKLLDPTLGIKIGPAGGVPVWESGRLPAGESEHAVGVVLEEGRAEFWIDAEFDEAIGETAIFVTLLPDGMDERTAWATGGRRMKGALEFVWEDGLAHGHGGH